MIAGTSNVDESKTQSFKVLDNFTGAEATLAAALKLNVYTSASISPHNYQNLVALKSLMDLTTQGDTSNS